MRASRGEIKIEEILREAELNFRMEYSFEDLKSPNGRYSPGVAKSQTRLHD